MDIAIKSKGKDFTSASGDDNVYTPYSFTEQLLENEKFDYTKTVLEPAMGEGSIVKILFKYFKNVCGDDINNSGYNYLTDQNKKYNLIITNPPYSKLDKFIIKAKETAIEKFAFLCKLTHLGGVDRFNKGIFKDDNYPLTKIYLFTRQANLRFFDKEKELALLNHRIKYYNNGDEFYNILNKKIKEAKKQIDYPKLRNDGKYPAGMYYYCWLIWENIKFLPIGMKDQVPIFKWIDNNKYILGKKDIC